MNQNKITKRTVTKSETTTDHQVKKHLIRSCYVKLNFLTKYKLQFPSNTYKFKMTIKKHKKKSNFATYPEKNCPNFSKDFHI